uniref:CSON003715 protein n=1 Tax=Culicoides sonorensis TaxID=179676 RepID=A0A336L5T9_CULSO
MTHLILDACVLSTKYPPVSTFLVKNKNINVSIYEKVIFGCFTTDFEIDSSFLWQTLGKTVTHLDVTKFECQDKSVHLLDVLPHFSSLTTLTLDHLKFLNIFKTTEKFKCLHDKMAFKSISDVHLYNFDSTDFDSILFFFPNIKNVYIESILQDTVPIEIINAHSGILRRLILNVTPREWDQILTNLAKLTDLNLNKLECYIEKEQTFESLCSFISHQTNLKKIILHTNRCFISQDMPGLEILYIDFIQDLMSFKAFSGIRYLKELHLKLARAQHRFQHQNSECFFGHQKYELRELKYLYLEEFGDKTCHECWKGLFESCLALKTLSISQTTISSAIFDLLVQYQKNLKELRIELAMISEQKILDLCHAFPNLEVLELKAVVVQGCSDSLLLTMVQNLPFIRDLRVTMLDITETSFDHIANHAYNLETLYLSIGVGNIDLERIFRPFEFLPKLKRICNILASQDITRIDYHEVYEKKTKTLESYLEKLNFANNQINYYTMTWDIDETLNIAKRDSYFDFY